MGTWKPMAAFIAVVLVLAACTGAGESTTSPESATTTTASSSLVADTPQEPGESVDTPEGRTMMAEATAIAQAYIEAHNAYDAKRARDLVSEDFRTNEHPNGWVDLKGIEQAFEGHEAYGFHYSEGDCLAQAEPPDRVQVACDYQWSYELQRILSEPTIPAHFNFVVEWPLQGNGDARITRVTYRDEGSLSDSWDTWLAFLGSEHPEFGAVVSRALSLDSEPHRELVEGLPRYLDLFAEWLDSQEG